MSYREQIQQVAWSRVKRLGSTLVQKQNKAIRYTKSRIHSHLGPHHLDNQEPRSRLATLRRCVNLCGLKISRKPIVLIYQMGKVGSTSIYRSLEAEYSYRFEIYHTHLLNTDYALDLDIQRRNYGWLPAGDIYDETYTLNQALVKPQYPLNIITMIRDPISRNISAYFNNLHLVWGIPDAHKQKNLCELAQGFWKRETHDLPLEWFDREFRNMVGLDVYAHPFPHDVGSQYLKSKDHKFLILRLDLPDQAKEESICQFLGINDFKIMRANVADAKAYALAYKNFLCNVKIPEWYVDKMLNSKFARHFFNEKERQQRIQYWLRCPRGNER